LECEEEKFLPKTNGRPFLFKKKLFISFKNKKKGGMRRFGHGRRQKTSPEAECAWPPSWALETTLDELDVQISSSTSPSHSTSVIPPSLDTQTHQLIVFVFWPIISG
jgi:hypothetical protein